MRFFIEILVLIFYLAFCNGRSQARKERCGFIQHFGSKCIHPLGGSPTSPLLPEGTLVVTESGCREDRLYFCKTSKGELRHKTSRLCIVPESNDPGNNERLVFGQCGSSLAKFVLLDNGSIENVATGKCWHPLGGSANPDNKNPVVLYDGCGEDRLQFTWHSEDEAEIAKPSEDCGYIQHFGSKCIHPLGGSPTSPEGTLVVTHSGCQEDRLYFCKTSNGELKHKTSGLCIVPESNDPGNNERLVFGECGSSLAKFNLLDNGSIENDVTGKCWHPLGGSANPDDNNPVVLHDGCGEDRPKFTWIKNVE